MNDAELQFRRLLDTLPVGAYMCDPAGLITYFNECALQLWGRAPKLNDAVDRFCGSFKLFATDGTPLRHDQCWMALALKKGEGYNGQEIIIERPDGSRITALAHANPIRDHAGKLLGAVNVLINVGERDQAEQARALLAAIVESSEDAIVSKTLEGRILTWNSGAEQIFGYTAAEAIGSPITLIIPPDRLSEERLILAQISHGERVAHYETVRMSKSGRRIDISLTISPVKDGTGRIIGASKIARDISARKQADQALLSLKEDLARQVGDLERLHVMSARLLTMAGVQPILDETLRAAATIDGTGMGLLFLSDEEQGRLRVGASLGFDNGLVETIDHVSPGWGASGVCLRERRRIVVEDVDADPLFSADRKAAQHAGLRAMHCTPLVTRAGRVIGVLSTCFQERHRPSDRQERLIDLCARQAVDFIENAQLYDQLREADRRKDEFLATLGHELRNPLAPISNSMHLLRLDRDLSPTAQRLCEVMERQIKHMMRLVDDMLEVSRITRGKIELRKEQVPLASIISSAVELSRPLIDAADHQLAITLPQDPVIVEVDSVRLTQVVANLLNNAAKYTQDGGQIWLNAHREGNEVLIAVRDTGAGIPADMLPHVFDMFAQVNRTLTRAQGGLGIGLTLVKSLVEMHGGRVRASSEGPGKGSEFLIRLPVAKEVEPSATLTDKPRQPRSIAAMGAHRIVIVDDRRDSAFVLAKLLEMLNQDVRTASDAVSALEMIRRDRPDIVISDIGMPEVDGYELARRIRAVPEFHDIVLVALTGFGQAGDKQRAKDAGFDMHLIKPVSASALEDLIATMPIQRGRADRSHV